MTEEQAKSRFMTLNLVRLLGLAFVMAGAANIAGKLLPELAPWLGALLMANGVADFFLAPRFLKRRWQNQDK